MSVKISFEDPYFQLAESYVNRTSRHIFLTGRAGTGKTTFLKYIVETCPKQVLVSAPTGVAAINAGGVTLHSLFQLPLEPYIPNSRVKDTYKFNQQKLRVIRQADLLIIDEVSMLRADTLDAIDTTLKFIRRNNKPFGGLQMLYIGDMFQLPPVVKDEEWNILKAYYKSPFFFHAKAIEQTLPVYLELKKIFRQTQQNFIELLNRVRNNNITFEDLEKLNSRYVPDFETENVQKPIILCTHNSQAEQINSVELQAIKTPLHVFEGEITGEFSQYALPTEMRLQLKEGAKIMFIRNDSQEPRRYFNGKIATVDLIDETGIYARPDGAEKSFKIEKELWENIRYGIDKEKHEITEETIGSFKQYPVRLAWAITIHKSQGLTFERAVIDLARAFAAGQAYVALSRCTSLEGIVLQSPVEAHCIQTDQYAIAFSANEQSRETLECKLEEDKAKFRAEQLINHFDFKPLTDLTSDYKRLTAEKISDELQAAHELAIKIFRSAWELQQTATKFQGQLSKRLHYAFDEQTMLWLKERCSKAVEFFHNGVKTNILTPLQNHIITAAAMKKAKTYYKHLREIETDIIGFTLRLSKATYGETGLIDTALELPSLRMSELDEEQAIPKGKPVKGSSQRLSLQMFLEGNTPEDIAKERQLAVSTVETHLVGFIKTGELSVTDFLPLPKVEKILPLVEAAMVNPSVSTAAIKAQLGDEYSFNEIRAVLYHCMRREKEGKEE